MLHTRSTHVAYATYVAYAKYMCCICNICRICEAQMLHTRNMLHMHHNCHTYAIYVEYARRNSLNQLAIFVCKEREVVASNNHPRCWNIDYQEFVPLLPCSPCNCCICQKVRYRMDFESERPDNVPRRCTLDANTECSQDQAEADKVCHSIYLRRPPPVFRCGNATLKEALSVCWSV